MSNCFEFRDNHAKDNMENWRATVRKLSELYDSDDYHRDLGDSGETWETNCGVIYTIWSEWLRH